MPHITPSDNGAILENPMMGWVHHHYDNHIAKYGDRLATTDALTDFPGMTTCYLRLAWSYLEPEEGRYDWSIFDAPAQRFIQAGKRIALRVSCSESELPNATPEWVRKAGAKVNHFKPGKLLSAEESERWEPDFEDPIFLAKLDNFLAALAARYDGDPNVDFIDVGSFGVWGEGHTYWSTRLNYSADAIIRHIDLHLKHFKKTMLVSLWPWVDHGRGPRALAYATSRGLSMRTDSILVLPMPDLYHPEHAADIWPRLPVVLESEHYGFSVDRKAWGDGSGFLQAVEEYHASLVSTHWWPREMRAAIPDLMNRISMRMGYRLQLASAEWPEKIVAGSRLPFAAVWKNAGVAPCYPGGHVTLTFKDAQGGIVAVLADDTFDVRRLPVGAAGAAEPVTHKAALPIPFNVPPGTYDVFVSVGSAIGTPKIALPLDHHDGHRRYRLGSVTVTAAS